MRNKRNIVSSVNFKDLFPCLTLIASIILLAGCAAAVKNTAQKTTRQSSKQIAPRANSSDILGAKETQLYKVSLNYGFSSIEIHPDSSFQFYHRSGCLVSDRGFGTVSQINDTMLLLESFFVPDTVLRKVGEISINDTMHILERNKIMFFDVIYDRE